MPDSAQTATAAAADAAAVLQPEQEIIDPLHFARHGYPHEAWRTLRQQAPVAFWHKNARMPFWAITKHADIVQISRAPEKFLNGPDLVIQTEAANEDPNFKPPPTLIQLDPPKHGEYRKIISKRLKPGALRKFHGDIEQIAQEIIHKLLAQGDEGECDFVEQVSAPLPIAVIAWLLGVPRGDWQLLFDWTNRIIGAADPEYQAEGKSANETARAAMAETFGYFNDLVAEKKKNPADDLISLFVRAEVNGKPLPPMDVLAYCLIIVVAGNETTRNATSGGMLALIENPHELRRVQQNPALLKPCMEEMLRWTSPIIHFARTAAVDVEIRGRKIKAGEKLALFYPSANRDEEVFEAPYEFRIDRSPNRHLAFGIGEHFCAGAHVARLELEFAFKHLLPRIEAVELAGPVQHLRSCLVGGVKHLPIRYKLRPA